MLASSIIDVELDKVQLVPLIQASDIIGCDIGKDPLIEEDWRDIPLSSQPSEQRRLPHHVLTSMHARGGWLSLATCEEPH